MFPVFIFHIKETQSSAVSNVWRSNKYKMAGVVIENGWAWLREGRSQVVRTSTDRKCLDANTTSNNSITKIDI